METTDPEVRGPDRSGGCSVVLAERVLRLADSLELPGQWRRLGFGRPSGRATAYPTDRRIGAVLAGLACGLRGVAPGRRARGPPCTGRRCRTGRSLGSCC